MSSPTPTKERDTEHEVLTCIRVNETLANITDNECAGKMKMKINTPLTKALGAVSCIPFVQIPVYPAMSEDNASFTIGDVDAGNLYNPKVDVILQKSTPSSFGRGSETVLDQSYRSGREIPAADIRFKDIGLQRVGFKTRNHIENTVLDDVKMCMFPGREVELKLYKLAVYETGGHFDWHMDSTHSDKHHGTLLVALNTSWEGGNLVLRRNGIETPVDLHPRQHFGWHKGLGLQAVAFYTDTEHRVEPVKEGIRVVLQYDIEIRKKPEDDVEKPEEETDKSETNEKETDEEEDEEGEAEDEEEEDDDEPNDPWMSNFSYWYSKRMNIRGIPQAKEDKAAVKKVLRTIKRMHSGGTQEVAFALQYLYRKASISAEYLKGSDAVIHDALVASGDFEISLHPVILQEESGDGGVIEKRYAYRYDTVEVDGDSGEGPLRKRRRVENEGSSERSGFHIPDISAIQEISSKDYVEHTGNEAMLGEYRYFGGGMFVRLKAK